MELNIKPLSVNCAWQGRRFKSPAYKVYENSMMYLLPKIDIPDAPYKLFIEFSITTLSDIDNPLKPFLDCLQKKYGINDRDIIELHVKKKVVKKGHEKINFYFY